MSPPCPIDSALPLLSGAEIEEAVENLDRYSDACDQRGRRACD
jgi:hypothetical protein